MSLIKNKKYIIGLLLIILLPFVFMACGEGGSSEQIDMGNLQENHSDELNTTKAILNVKAIYGENEEAELNELKICNSDKCWTIISNESIGKNTKKKAMRKMTKLSDDSDLIDVGSYVIKDINESIDTLKYVYNGKSGELKLKNKIKFNNNSDYVLYAKLEKQLTVPLQSFQFPAVYGENIFFIHTKDFKYTLKSGQIIVIPEGSIKESAMLYANQSKSGRDIDGNELLVKPFSLLFYSVSEVGSSEEVKNNFQKQLVSNIKVYLPIKFNNISDIENYNLIVNDKIHDYKLVKINSTDYILFETRESELNIIFDKNIMILEEL